MRFFAWHLCVCKRVRPNWRSQTGGQSPWAETAPGEMTVFISANAINWANESPSTRWRHTADNTGSNLWSTSRRRISWTANSVVNTDECSQWIAYRRWDRHKKNHSLDAWLFTWRIVTRCKFITTNAKLSVQIELTFYIFAKISSTKSNEINLTANLLTLNSSGTEFLITALKKQLSKIRHSSSITTHLARNLGFMFLMNMIEHRTFSDA